MVAVKSSLLRGDVRGEIIAQYHCQFWFDARLDELVRVNWTFQKHISIGMPVNRSIDTHLSLFGGAD